MSCRFQSFSIDSCLDDVQPGKLEKTISLHGERGKLSGHLAEKIVGIFTMQTRISTSSQFLSLFAQGGGRVWLTFRRLLTSTHETESEQTRHFYGLFARLQHCLLADRRMKIESSIVSSPGKELTGNSMVGAELEQFHG